MNDLRSYLDVVRSSGEIHDIKRTVDPVRELGAVLRACEKADKAAFTNAIATPAGGGSTETERATVDNQKYRYYVQATATKGASSVFAMHVTHSG